MIIPNEPLPPAGDNTLDFDDFEVSYEVSAAAQTAPSDDFLSDCERFFTAGGVLSGGDFGARDYEERPQQTAMAMAVAKALVSGNNLCVEAPTGVGKSFAYLVPLIYRSRYCALPSVVSTETINLQEQLMDTFNNIKKFSTLSPILSTSVENSFTLLFHVKHLKTKRAS